MFTQKTLNFTIYLTLITLCFLTLINCKSHLPQGWVYTPSGPKRIECVHRVPSGSIIEEEEDFFIITPPSYDSQYTIYKCGSETPLSYSKRSALTYDGWLAYTTYKSKDPNGFSSFLGYFSVPNNPQEDPSILYLFTGLQNVDWIPLVDPEPPVFDIIQPVLQYPADSGYGWSVKSWYVTLSGDVLYSDEILVNAGDNIFGNMTRVSSEGFYIGGTSQKTGQTSSITVTGKQRLSTQPWAYNTLECYGCDYYGCNAEPTTPCLFTKLSLLNSEGKNEIPKWTPHVSPNPVCKEKAVVKSPSTVDIHFDYKNE